MSNFLLKFSLLTLIFFYLLLTQKYFVINRQIFPQNDVLPACGKAGFPIGGVVRLFLPRYLSGCENKKPILKNLPRNSVFVPKTLNVEQIFADDHYWVATLSAEKLTTIIATGDVNLGRSINYQIRLKQNPNYPFEKIVDQLRNVDIAIVNLESPLIKACPETNEGMKFCGNNKNVAGLTYAGIDVVSVANNHIDDYGVKGIEETNDLLTLNEITVVGNGQMVFRDVKGINFAILAYDLIKHPLEKNKLREDVQSAKKVANVVVVIFHWGLEYTSRPTQKQREIAHFVIDNGADLVIGGHPHWIQPIEIYKEKLIVYSHGNFIFDQLWSKETKEGIIGEYTFYKEKLIDVKFLPIVINDSFQPFLAEEVEAGKILNQMREASLGLK